MCEDISEAYHEGLEEGFKPGLKAAKPSARFIAACATMQSLLAHQTLCDREMTYADVASDAVRADDALLAELAKGEK